MTRRSGCSPGSSRSSRNGQISVTTGKVTPLIRTPCLPMSPHTGCTATALHRLSSCTTRSTPSATGVPAGRAPRLVRLRGRRVGGAQVDGPAARDLIVDRACRGRSLRGAGGTRAVCRRRPGLLPLAALRRTAEEQPAAMAVTGRATGPAGLLFSCGGLAHPVRRAGRRSGRPGRVFRVRRAGPGRGVGRQARRRCRSTPSSRFRDGVEPG